MVASLSRLFVVVRFAATGMASWRQRRRLVVRGAVALGPQRYDPISVEMKVALR